MGILFCAFCFEINQYNSDMKTEKKIVINKKKGAKKA